LAALAAFAVTVTKSHLASKRSRGLNERDKAA
jgi:hypothetical protein